MLLYRLVMMLLAVRELSRRSLARDWTALEQRLGRTPPPNAGRHIWVHAASNGELASARPVLERLAADGRAILLTTNTDSGVALAQGWDLPHVAVRHAPLDLPGPTRRILRRWQVAAHITFESELWPYRILLCPGPVIALGARLTERSAKGWQRFDGVVRRVMARVAYLSAQDAASRDRFRAFGLAPSATGPVLDLKALYTAPEDGPDADLQTAFDRSQTWLAASTHEGEDDVILRAHVRAKAHRPSLKLILAPRHPRRADAVEALIHEHGLTCARRSRNDPPDADIYLADTMGEMHLWYALAGVTFVAGSLTDRGGHTPYEPATFGSALLHGPDTGNFRAAYNRLAQAHAAICVASADALADALRDLADPAKQADMGDAARRALRQDTDIDGLMRDVFATVAS